MCIIIVLRIKAETVIIIFQCMYGFMKKGSAQDGITFHFHNFQSPPFFHSKECDGEKALN